MTATRWHILEGDTLVLTRRLPARFDVVAETMLPPVTRLRGLAHQIRQDVWRALQRQKGFSPVIELLPGPDALRVRAGGQIDQRRFAKASIEARLAAILDDPARRARWITHASRPARQKRGSA